LTETITRDLETKRQGGHVKRAFSAEAQRISITGDHRYVCDFLNKKLSIIIANHYNSQIAPGSNDLRGPCPGLNAMANHGYLPRNGMSTITQMTKASNEGSHDVLTLYAPR
jgi:hypothetical protein